MTEDEIQVFIKGTISYFAEVSGENPEVGIPYNKGDENILLDYTGHIGISGARKGGLYITCSKELLAELSKVILQSDDIEEDTILDMIGEVANTIAGNARETFGGGFMISVPTIFAGAPTHFRIILNTPIIVVPVVWRGLNAFLVIGID